VDISIYRFLLSAGRQMARMTLLSLAAFLLFCGCADTQEEEVERLILSLKAADYDVKRESVTKLAGIGRAAVVPLIDVLKDDDYITRMCAADALGRIGDRRAVEPLIAALRNKDEHPGVRASAIEALGKIADERAIVPLIAILRIENPFPEDGDCGTGASVFLTTARDALVEIGRAAAEPLIEELKTGPKCSRYRAAEILGYICDERVVEPLFEALKDEAEIVGNSSADALYHLAFNGLKDIEVQIIRAFQDGSGTVRQRLVRHTGELTDRRAVTPLIDALSDQDSDVRANAARALGEIGDNKASDSLIKALKDEHCLVRVYSAEALGNLKEEKAVEHLIQALKDKDLNVVNCASESLGIIGSDKPVNPLIAILNNDNWSVRQLAVTALGHIGSRKAVNALKRMWEEEKSEYVRPAIAYALARIDGDEDAFKFLVQTIKNSSSPRRRDAVKALGYIGSKEAINVLVGIIENEKAQFRSEATEALGESGSTDAFEPLVQALSDKWYLIRANAARGLGKLGGKRAIDLLISALEDATDGVRSEAARALGNIGDEKAITPLIEALKDEDDNTVRRSIVLALRKITSQSHGFDYATWKAWYEKNTDK
jgi:HEAT repeat protein